MSSQPQALANIALMYAVPLFGESCTVMPGILNFAYGPCLDASDSPIDYPPAFAPAAPTAPIQPILKWLEVLGMHKISEVSPPGDACSCVLLTLFGSEDNDN